MRAPTSGPWATRVTATDWDSVHAGLDSVGCALTGPLLTSTEAQAISALYTDDSRFRSTVDMGRYRFGEGQYRYFAEPFPDAITELKQALYPKLLPIARDWWTRLKRDTPWPDTLQGVVGHVPRRRADEVDADFAQVRRG